MCNPCGIGLMVQEWEVMAPTPQQYDELAKAGVPRSMIDEIVRKLRRDRS